MTPQPPVVPPSGEVVRRDRVCPHCGKPIGKVARLSMTVPADLARYARRTAQAEGRTVSSVVAEAIRQYREALS